jgi:molecular chaperone DnaK (HSP70)
METKNLCSIGIDLGTTHSCVGVYKGDGIVDILANEHGYRTTPSCVSFDGEERYIGKTAKEMSIRNPKNTVYDVKRLMGLLYSDTRIQKEKKYLSYSVISDKNDCPLIEVDYMNERKCFYPEQIQAMILEKMKQIAETFTGTVIKNVVITVPAYFNDTQRRATENAGTIAGLTIQRIINEPTAAAIAYGLHNKGNRNILIFDLGGGTLDVTILKLSDGQFDVLATNGDTHLGGEDFDNKIREYCVQKFSEKHILKQSLTEENKKELLSYLSITNLDILYDFGTIELEKTMSSNSNYLSEPCRKYIEQFMDVLELQENGKKMCSLKIKCEEAKKSLSNSNSIKITCDNFYNNIDLDIKLTRRIFENLCAIEFEKCMIPVQNAMKDANLTDIDINDVVLVGGSTRIPKIHEILNKSFPDKLRSDINPDEAVAYGATVQAAMINQIFDSVTSNIFVCDATPLSVGIETRNGIMDVMIERNTPIPCEVTKTYTTSQDNQTSVTIIVYEGERKMTKQNNMLGHFDLDGIPAMRAREAKIKVTFSINHNGIMSVNAYEETTGNSKNIIIKNEKNRLKDDEISKMIEEAEKFSLHDKEQAENLQSKMNLENYIDTLRNEISNDKFQKKIGENECKKLTEEIEIITNWIDDNCDTNVLNKIECDKRYNLLVNRMFPLLEILNNKK